MSTKIEKASFSFFFSFFLFLLSPEYLLAQTRRAGPLFVSGGLGPFVLFDVDTGFRFEGQFGWHLRGVDEGFFMGFDFTISVEDYFIVHSGFRLGGDIEVYRHRDLSVLITPQGLFGFGWIDFGREGDYGFFLIEPSFQGAIGLFERVLWFWIRPIGFDFLLFPEIRRWRRGNPEEGFDWYWGYHFLGGVRFNFG
ncbi:MAG: hypothetical protein NZM37_00455 [Sandaracinaceae bacterium]|nr:hypothetical protein [Sandaracinaceae bacterium]MDW8246393.1 hypothetical protein [Sandaracinaceae bacterium]